MKLSLATLLVCSAAQARTLPDGASEAVTTPARSGFVLEISKASGLPFYVPITAANQRVAVIPLVGSTASAIRVVPKAMPNGVRVRVYALYGDGKKLSNVCDDVKSLPADLVGTYELTERKNTMMVDSDFALGPNLIHLELMAPKVTTPAGTVQLALLEKDAAGGCCGCNGLSCCPNPGFCLTCDVCGQCCAQKQEDE